MEGAGLTTEAVCSAWAVVSPPRRCVFGIRAPFEIFKVDMLTSAICIFILRYKMTSARQ